MRNSRQHQFHISGLAVLLVLAVFALCLLLVLLTGARVYAGLAEDGGLHHAQRTAAAYLSTRLQQSGRVYTEDFDGTDALVFPETIGGKTYLTRVYCHDGWLRELFTGENGDFSPADGEKLLEMTELSLIMEEELLQLHFTLPQGETGQVLWHRGGTSHEK